MSSVALRIRNILPAIFVALFSLAIFLTPAPASAAGTRYGSCQGDPKIYLSNGKVITVTEAISTDASNVTQVVYVFHMPGNVKLNRIVKSDTGISAKEVYIFFYDKTAGNYTVDVVVQVKVAAVSVSVTSAVGSAKKTVSGKTGQHIFAALYSK